MRDLYEQLRRIQEAITKIVGYTRGGRDSFDKEERIRLAIIYYLQVIKQAAHAIPQSFKDHHPEISWEQIVDTQDYFSRYDIEADQDALWKIATQDLPALEPGIDAALAEKDARLEKESSAPIVRGRNTTADLQQLVEANREAILRIAARYGASNVRIFGSVARGEADTESDIDLLVDMESERTLLDYAELLIDLQTLLGRKLDVITEQGLNDRMRERILKEAVKL